MVRKSASDNGTTDPGDTKCSAEGCHEDRPDRELGNLGDNGDDSCKASATTHTYRSVRQSVQLWVVSRTLQSPSEYQDVHTRSHRANETANLEHDNAEYEQILCRNDSENTSIEQ